MKGVQPRNVGLEVAGMLCTALLLGHYPLHTGREIYLSLRNRYIYFLQTMAESEIKKEKF